ncbi:pickpocket protein 28-like [Zophobas morio]|uniref:pickpocket protein 28-like n=1 Tax=Zophobas morio TaxID=2755281 RepID=UPI003082D654
MNLVSRCFSRMTVYEMNERANKEIAEPYIKSEEGYWHSLRKYLREYAEVTGLQGFRYVAEKRSTAEKIIWSLALIFSLGGCMYMISEILNKYENSPVVVSFATEDTPLYKIPFPAVTICPEAKYDTRVFNYSDIFYRVKDGKSVSKTNLTMFQRLSVLCEVKYPTEFENNTLDNEVFETIDKTKIEPRDMFMLCSYINETNGLGCESLFKPVFIDGGLCYSFNNLGRDDIFNDHVYNYAKYYEVPHKMADYFNVETGYKENIGIDAYPRRTLKPGPKNGMTILLKFDDKWHDPTCNIFFKGFRVLIHSPWEVPLFGQYYISVPTNKYLSAVVEGEYVRSSENLSKIKAKKRRCYMRDEYSLKYFKIYTQSNCFLECRTNYTLKQCGCVQYFMPRENTTAICGRPLHECTQQAESAFIKEQLEANLKGYDFCDCLPACSNLKFRVETSQDTFHVKEFWNAIGGADRYLEGWSWSLMHIYFKDEQIRTLERNELYGTSDLISNLGGLLGLFTGFSLLSIIEILYFCSLRIFCNKKIYGSWSGP